MPKPKSPFIYYLRFEWSNVLPFNGLFNLFVFTFNQNLGGIRTLVLILIRNYVTIIALQQRPRITYLVRNRLCWDKTFQEVFEVILGWILMTLRFLFKPSSFQSSLPLRMPSSLSCSHTHSHTRTLTRKPLNARTRTHTHTHARPFIEILLCAVFKRRLSSLSSFFYKEGQFYFALARKKEFFFLLVMSRNPKIGQIELD